MAIHKVGIELEGRWDTRPAGFTYDGSVGGFQTLGGAVGEVPSPPLTLDEVNPWLDANYPDEVNQSCGMHVHVSVESKAEYSLLMSHAAQLERDLIKNVKDWATEREIIPRHPLWERLAGRNRYCQMGTHGVENQTRARTKINARYRMLNFCWRLHGTLEIRLLPGFKKKHLGIEAVQTVIATVAYALSHYTGIPKEIIRETAVGTIECHAWKQGFTCFLDTSASLKRQIYTEVYGRGKSNGMLARLLKRERVTIPIATLETLNSELEHVEQVLNRFQVTLTRTNTDN
jgi:hypothetical protein